MPMGVDAVAADTAAQIGQVISAPGGRGELTDGPLSACIRLVLRWWTRFRRGFSGHIDLAPTALALIAPNSSCVIVPLSRSCLAFSISLAGPPVPAARRMY